MEYKHYSFDLWLTLIRSDSSFKRKRAELIHKRYAPIGISVQDVENIIKDVEKMYDAITEMNGRFVNAWEAWAVIIFRIQGHVDNLSPLKMELLYQEVEQLFMKHPPILYDDDTYNVLEELRKRGKTMSLLSNTGLPQGRTLEKVLEHLGIIDFFMVRGYSDQIGYSKPNAEAFRWVHDRLIAYECDDIIHIGDNPIADGAGAHEYGFGSMVINSNSYTIKDVL